jgi:hypothetical protein
MNLLTLRMLLISAGIAFAGNVNSIGPIHITGNAGFATCGCARLVGGDCNANCVNRWSSYSASPTSGLSRSPKMTAS